MQFRNWNLFSFLNSHPEPWLSFSSMLFNVDPKLIYLCGLGLLLLFIFYLVGIPSFFNIWNARRKCRIREKRRRKGGTRKGWRRQQRDAEEERKLVSLLKRTSCRKPDTICFRRLLCPDPSCEVCNSVTSEVSQLLFPDILEDSPPFQPPLTSRVQSSVLSPASSRGPAADPTLCSLRLITRPPLCTSSPHSATSTEGFLTTPSPAHSLHPEPPPFPGSPLPVTHSPTQPLPSPPSDSTQRAISALQLGLPISLKNMYRADPIVSPENHLLPELMQRSSPAHAKELLYSTLPPSVFQKDLVELQGNPVTEHVEPGDLSFLRPEVLGLLERNIKSKINLLMEKEKAHSLLKQPKADYQLNPPEEISKMLANNADSAYLSLLKDEKTPKDQQILDQAPHSESLHGDGLQKPVQVSGGLPSLHSESLCTTVHPSEERSSTCAFNVIQDAPGDQDSAATIHPPNLTPAEAQSPSWPQKPLESQTVSDVQAKPQATLELTVTNLSADILSQIKVCGVSYHQPQEELELLPPSDIQTLELHVLQKKLSHLWRSTSVMQRSEENLFPVPPKRTAPRVSGVVPTPVSIVPGEFPLSPALRKELERHLKKRLIQHRWGLPQRIIESLSLMRPPHDLDQSSEAESKLEISDTHRLNSKPDQNPNAALSPSDSVHESQPHEPVAPEDDILQAHTEMFHRRMTNGGPPKFPDSTLTSVGGKPSHFNLLSTNLFPEKDSKSRSLKNTRESSQSNKIGMKDTAPIFDHHGPVPSSEGKMGHAIVRPLPSGSNPELSRVVWRTNTPHRKEIEDKELFSNVPIIREIFRAKELDDLPPSNHVLAADNPTNSQTLISVSRKESKIQLTPKMNDNNLPLMKGQLLEQGKLMSESKNQSQAQDQPVASPWVSSDTSVEEASVTQTQGDFPGDTEPPQVLHVHLEERGVSVEQEREPWVPDHVLKSQDKNFPPLVKKTKCPGPKTSELGGGDAGLGSIQHSRKTFSSKTSQVEEPEKKFSSQQVQPSAENLLINKLKEFWQRIFPTMKEAQVKGSLVSSCSRGSLNCRAAPIGKTDTQKHTNEADKSLLKQVGRRQASYATNPQKTTPSPLKSWAKRKLDMKAQREPRMHYSPTPRVPSKVFYTSSQAHPVSEGWSVVYRQPQRALSNTTVCPRHNTLMVQRLSLAPTSSRCRGHIDQSV